MEELKPCPFCSSDMIMLHIDRMGLSYIQCNGCNARIWHDNSHCYDPTTANIANGLVKSWNTRNGECVNEQI